MDERLAAEPAIIPIEREAVFRGPHFGVAAYSKQGQKTLGEFSCGKGSSQLRV